MLEDELFEEECFITFFNFFLLPLAQIDWFCRDIIPMRKYEILFCLFFLVSGCGKEDSLKVEESLPKPLVEVATISLEEHNRLLGEEKGRVENLRLELSQHVEDVKEHAELDEEIIKELEAQVEALNSSLTQFRLQVSESKNSLNALKKIGSMEYKVIYERAKNVEHEKAILLYEEFLEEFPNSPISSRARARIKFHNAEIQVVENRKSARTVRLWEAKLKGEGMFVRAVEEEELFDLIGRIPDSSKRGSSSEYKQRVYTWRDYVIDGGYHDLIISTTDGKVDQASMGK